MKEWITEGKRNWKKNMTTRAKEIQRQQYFEDREVSIFKDSLSKTLRVHDLDMQEGIEAF